MQLVKRLNLYYASFSTESKKAIDVEELGEADYYELWSAQEVVYENPPHENDIEDMKPFEILKQKCLEAGWTQEEVYNASSYAEDITRLLPKDLEY